MISDLGIAYSLRVRIEESLNAPTHIKFDGFELPKNKPFLIIESMQNNSESISKLRETINTTFRYQIGIYAESSFKMSKYQDELRDLLLFNEFQLYNDLGENTGRTFQIEPDFSETPIPSDDLTEVTNRHRIFFTIEIKQNIHKNK